MGALIESRDEFGGVLVEDRDQFGGILVEEAAPIEEKPVPLSETEVTFMDILRHFEEPPDRPSVPMAQLGAADPTVRAFKSKADTVKEPDFFDRMDTLRRSFKQSQQETVGKVADLAAEYTPPDYGGEPSVRLSSRQPYPTSGEEGTLKRSETGRVKEMLGGPTAQQRLEKIEKEGLPVIPPDMSPQLLTAYKDAALEAGPDRKQAFAEKLPFIGGVASAVRLNEVVTSAKNIESGNGTEFDHAVIGQFAAEVERDQGKGFWGGVGDIVAMLPGFMVEFAATGGAYTGAKKATETALKQGAVRWVASRAAGVAAMTAANPQRVVEAKQRRDLQNHTLTKDEQGLIEIVRTADDEGFAQAWSNAFADTMVELGSERTGSLLGNVPAMRKMKEGFARAFIARGGTAEKLLDTLKKGGWNGVFGEMLEERVGEGARAGLGLEDYEAPSAKQLLQEAVAFSVLPGVSVGVGMAIDEKPPREPRAPGEEAIPETESDAIRDAMAKADMEQAANQAEANASPQTAQVLRDKASNMGFEGFLKEAGRTAEDYRAASESTADVVPMPEAFQDAVAVGPSALEGQGIFAQTPVAKGDVVAPAFLYDEGIKRTIAGRFVNHADDASANATLEVRDGMGVLVAKAPLKAGEEITVDYREHLPVAQQLTTQGAQDALHKESGEILSDVREQPIEGQGEVPATGRTGQDAAARTPQETLAEGLKDLQDVISGLRDALTKQQIAPKKEASSAATAPQPTISPAPAQPAPQPQEASPAEVAPSVPPAAPAVEVAQEAPVEKSQAQLVSEPGLKVSRASALPPREATVVQPTGTVNPTGLTFDAYAQAADPALPHYKPAVRKKRLAALRSEWERANPTVKKSLTVEPQPQPATEGRKEATADDALNEIAQQYGWSVTGGKLINSAGKEVSDISVKKGRIRITVEGKLRGSIPESQPEKLGDYLEKTYFAKRTQPTARTEGEDIITRLEKKKLKGGETMAVIIPGLDPATARAVWNTAIDIAITAIKAGRAIKAAIDEAVAYIRSRAPEINEVEIRDALAAEISIAPPSGMTMRGEVQERGQTGTSRSAVAEHEYIRQQEAKREQAAKRMVDDAGSLEAAFTAAKQEDDAALRNVKLTEVLAQASMEQAERLARGELMDPALQDLIRRVSVAVQQEKSSAGQALQSNVQTNHRIMDVLAFLTWQNLNWKRQKEVITKSLDRLEQALGTLGGIAPELAGMVRAALASRQFKFEASSQPERVNLVQRIMDMFPRAGFRPFYNEKGADGMARAFLGLLAAKPKPPEGHIWAADKALSAELSALLRQTMQEMGLGAPSGEQLSDEKKLAMVLGKGDLRRGKIEAIDRKMQEEISKLDDGTAEGAARAAILVDAWNAVMSEIGTTTASNATLNRLLHRELRGTDWNARLEHPESLKSKTVDAIMERIEGEMTSDIGRAELPALRRELEAAFDNIIAIREARAALRFQERQEFAATRLREKIDAYMAGDKPTWAGLARAIGIRGVSPNSVREGMQAVVRLHRAGMLTNDTLLDAMAPLYGLESADGPTAKKLAKLTQRAADAPRGVIRNKVYQEMERLIMDSMQVSPWQVVQDFWYASVLSGPRTWFDVLFGSGFHGFTIAAREALDTAIAKRTPLNALRIFSQLFAGYANGALNLMDIVKSGDYSRLPDAERRLMQFLANPQGQTHGRALEAMKRSDMLWKKLVGQMAFVHRIMVGLDYVGALGTRDATIVYSTLSRGDIDRIDRMQRMFDKRESQRAERQARTELGPNAKRVDLLARKREILEEGISQETKDIANEMARIAALNADPVGIGKMVYDFVARLPFLVRAPSGLAFARAGINMLQNATDWMPLLGAVNWGRAFFPESSLGLKLTPERQRLILWAQLGGLTIIGTLMAIFLGNDDDEERTFDIAGGWKGLTPQQRGQLMGQGERPYSLKVGNRWYSYRNSPLLSALAVVGYMRDQQRFQGKEWTDQSKTEHMMNAWLAGFAATKETAPIQGFTALFSDSPYQTDVDYDKALKKIAGSAGGFAAGFVPTMAKDIETWFDPKLYRPEQGHEYFWRNLPVIRQTVGVGPALNILGEPIEVARYPLSRFQSPENRDPAWTALAKQANLGHFMPSPSKTATIIGLDGNRRQMNAEEYYLYQKLAGEEYRRMIESDLGPFESATDEDWPGWLELFREARELAQEQVEPTE